MISQKVLRVVLLACIWTLPAALAAEEPAQAPGPDKALKKDRKETGKKVSEAAAPLKDPVVTVKNKGKDPRKELRYTPDKGCKSSLAMTLRMEMTTEMGAFKPPQTKIPAQETKFDFEVTSVSPNGDIAYNYRVSDVKIAEGEEGVNPMVSNAMKTQLEGIKGLSGSAVVTARGFTKKATVTVPEGASPTVKQMLESMTQSAQQFSAPLPEEAVGVGAVWTVATTIEQNGMSIDQTTTYEVLGFEGDAVQLKAVVEQSAKEQEVHPSGVPAGMKVKLISYKGKGEGKTTLQMAQIVPKAAEMALESTNQMAVDSGGAAPGTEVTTKVKMRTVLTGSVPSKAGPTKAKE